MVMLSHPAGMDESLKILSAIYHISAINLITLSYIVNFDKLKFLINTKKINFIILLF